KAPQPGSSSTDFVTVRVDDPELTAQAVAAGAKLTGVRPSDWLSWAFPILLALLFLLPLLRGRGAGLSPLAFGKSTARVSMEASTGVTFQDIAGVDEAIE